MNPEEKRCILCSKIINNYDSNFNNLKIDEEHIANLCSECIDKFMAWQGEIVAKLFPTKALKKRYGSKK